MKSIIEAFSLTSIAQSIQKTVLDIWGDFVSHLPYLAAGLLAVLTTWGAAAAGSMIVTRIMNRSRFRPSLKELARRFTSIVIWFMGLLIAAMVVFPGLTPSKALGALGVASIAIGLAFKDIFENFFAGVLILWKFPFEHGDYITCEDVTGQVEDVTVRMTKIRHMSGKLVVVPNTYLFKNPVEVLTSRPKRRAAIMAGVAYGEDVYESVEVIENAVRSCKSVDLSKEIQVFPQGFGSSSIDIEVAWWTNPRPVDIRRSRGEVVAAIKRDLDAAGIEIPFPYRTLTFKEPLKTISGSAA